MRQTHIAPAYISPMVDFTCRSLSSYIRRRFEKEHRPLKIHFELSSPRKLSRIISNWPASTLRFSTYLLSINVINAARSVADSRQMFKTPDYLHSRINVTNLMCGFSHKRFELFCMSCDICSKIKIVAPRNYLWANRYFSSNLSLSISCWRAAAL